MTDMEHATTEETPTGVGYFEIDSDRWVSTPPPPPGPEVAERLDEQAERVRKERERRQWLRESGW